MTSYAVHGPTCNARTFPTRCQYCSKNVFYFACDHGSKVFFEQLGVPWPEHKCLEYLKTKYGTAFVAYGMAAMMMTPGVEIGQHVDPTYAARVQAVRIAPKRQEIMRLDPYAGVTERVEGLVRELTPVVNIYQRFRVALGTVGAAFLGPLAHGNYAQVTVHTAALADEDYGSYTFFLNHQLLAPSRIRTGDLLICRLGGVAVHDGRGALHIVWLCDEVSDLFGM